MKGEEERFLTVPGLGRCPGVRHLFGTREVDTPKKAAALLGLAKDSAVTVRQVHGDAVWIVDSRTAKKTSPESGHDALVTRESGIFIGVGTADCVPILIADRGGSVIAAVHAGWRGTLSGIAAKVVKTLEERFGCPPSELVAGIGPSAGACCYEVDGIVLEPLKARLPYWARGVRSESRGKAMLDLRELNRLQLAGAGVTAERIESIEQCTICSGNRFSSFRRQGRKMGTMYSGIALRPA